MFMKTIEAKTVGILKNARRTKIHPPEFQANLELREYNENKEDIKLNLEKAKDLGFVKIANNCQKCNTPNTRQLDTCSKCGTSLFLYEKGPVGVDVKVKLGVQVLQVLEIIKR